MIAHGLSILSHDAPELFKAALSIVVAEERALDGPENLTGKTTAQIGLCTLKPQPVEKVVVGPVGSPREPENTSKTLRKRRIRPPNRGAQESATEFFNTLGNSQKFAGTEFSENHVPLVVSIAHK